MRKGLHYYISTWLGAIMPLVVIALSVLLIFTDLWKYEIYGTKRVALIMIFLAYAAWRIARLSKARKQANEEEG